MQDLKETEKQILEFWKKNKIYGKSKKKNAKGKKFYFLQGPPYTSGRLHIGHAWNNSMKDVILRYKRMQNFDVWDRAGYDMHGLPTENKVQKELKLADKKEIIKYGIDKFAKRCMEFSSENAKLMSEDLKRLGIWMDFENAYLPISNDFISAEWLLIKNAYEQKRMYKGKKVMQWCGECETSLAKHELEYENVAENSIYARFKLKNEEGYLVVWTTTPWTIPFNLGVMANPDLEYAKVKADEVYIVAKELAEHLFKDVLKKNYKIIETFKGKKLEGLKYNHPFSDTISFPKEKKAHTVLLSKEYVNLDAGTGLVHCAPGCGPEDYEVGQKYGISAFNNIDEKGIFFGMGEFNGMSAKKDDAKFIKALENRKALLGQEKVSHEYAHCWRCHNPVIFRATEQWFLKIEDLVKKILEYNKKINWVPDFAKKNYELWIENLRDNGLTRQRFWGVPMPVWECKCGGVQVIGSLDELKKKALNKVPENLHKPWIDDVKLKCPKCKKEMTRVPDVLDVWIDSGTASWNCLYYPARQDYFKKYFPADLILEATEQTRLWFSMLQICSEIMFKKPCYKNVYAHGMIFDFQGTKMSKSLGNVISPYEVVDKFSSDIFRYYICQIRAGENINFNWEDVKQKQRNLNVLMNIGNYIEDLLQQEKLGKQESKKLDLEERYILSRANSTIKNATELFDAYKIDETIGEIEKLFLDLSRVYIKMTRDKSNDDETRKLVLQTAVEVYVKCLQMFSTTCPLITEHLWQRLKNVVKEESIHLSSWPKAENKMINKKLEEDFEFALKVIEAGLASRAKSGIGLKWPLAKAEIFAEKELGKELQEIIKRQLNVKMLEIKKSKSLEVKLDEKMTPELEAEGYAREISRNVQALRKNAGLVKKDIIELVIAADVNLEKHKEFIKERTNAGKILIQEKSDAAQEKKYKNKTEEKIKDKKIKILFNKI